MGEQTIDRRRDLYEQRFQAIDTKLDNIGNALVTLARIDERQIAISENLVQVIDMQASHGERLAAVERSLPNNMDARLSAVEVVMPQLKEARVWIVTGVMAGIGLIGLALVNLVLK